MSRDSDSAIASASVTQDTRYANAAIYRCRSARRGAYTRRHA